MRKREVWPHMSLLSRPFDGIVRRSCNSCFSTGIFWALCHMKPLSDALSDDHTPAQDPAARD